MREQVNSFYVDNMRNSGVIQMKKKIKNIILVICILLNIIYTNTKIQVHGETFDYYARFRLDYRIENNLLFVDIYADEFYNVGYIKLLYADAMFDKNILKFTNIYIEDYDNYEEWFNSTTGRFRIDNKYTAKIGMNDLVCTLEFTILNNTASTIISIENIDFTGTINDPYFEDKGTVNSPFIEVDLSSFSISEYAYLELSLENENVKVGDEIIINVSLTPIGFNGVLYFSTGLEYDHEYLQFIESTVVDNNNYFMYSNLYMMSKDPNGSGMVGIFMKLKFKALKKTNNTTVQLIDTDMSGANTKTAFIPLLENINEPPITFNIQSSNSSSGGSLSYNIDYANHQLIVANSNNNILFLGAEDKKGIVKSYELFEAGSNTTKIDLSKFPTKKEWKLKLYGDIDTTPISISLATRANKVKSIYNPLETTTAARITFTDNGTPVVLNKLEYRTSYSKWNDASTLTIDQLDAYSVHGTTLIFRIKAVENINPYSAEAKMKIAKKANAPKVTINYSNLTIKMSDKIEYRTSHSDTWIAGIKGAVSLKSITNIENNNLYLEVRTAATNGKAASKIAVITLAAQDNAPVINTNLKITNNITEDKTTSITIKNESAEKIIEYSLVDKNTQIASLDLTIQKWKKLNNGSEVILKEKESNGKKIIARYVAVTAKGETPKFASNISISSEIVWIK